MVDDQPEVRALLRDILEAENYVVDEATDGAAALTVQGASHPPDLIVLDHMMPELTGIDVLRQIRKDGSQIPIILLTAYGDDATTWEGWTSGASCFLEKPFDRALLLEWVGRLLADPPAPEPTATYDLASHHSLGDADGPGAATIG